MKSSGPAVFLVSLATLTFEVVLIRVFDFILTPNLGYLVISSAMFCLGFAGIYVAIRPHPNAAHPGAGTTWLPVMFGIAVLFVSPGLNALPFDFEQIYHRPLVQMAAFLGMLLLLGVPFFIAGLFFARTFSLRPDQIAKLYCWDLVGAALGSFGFLAVFKEIGPGGIMICTAAIAFLASAVLASARWARVALVLTSLALGTVPFLYPLARFDFRQHQDKSQTFPGGVKAAQRSGSIEFTAWDPVSRIDVLNGPRGKEILYDGGTQSTTVFPFDGDYRKLRDDVAGSALAHFWNRGVFASHYLMRDSGARVLVIGAGAGQEVKGALMFGASQIYAVEMVKSVLDLDLEHYARYDGRIFLDPRVRPFHGEGRAFVRAADRKFDVIQIYSNHTSSSIASGSGAADVSYLLTVEAFEDYFRHLSPSGILQINHPIYPRLVTTAARAWRELGLSDFRKHVVVWQRDPSLDPDIKPTFMVQMTPWTADELEDVWAFFSAKNDEKTPWVVAEDPRHPDSSFLPAQFFSGRDEPGLFRDVPYRVEPATDDRPFFKFIRSHFGFVKEDRRGGLDAATAAFLNAQMKRSIPMDVVHLVCLAALSIVVAAACVVVPLTAFRSRLKWSGKGPVLVYFSLLGFGFMMIEQLLIQKFMKIIGYPVYAFSTIILALLLSAGLGSLASARLRNGARTVTWLPFLGAVLYGAALMAGFGPTSELLMRSPTLSRAAVSLVLVIPLGFFLGMPFPFGIRAIEGKGRGAIAWAWGMNGLATVVGSLLAAVVSLLFGFDFALALALGCYVLAYVALCIVENKGSLAVA